MQPENNLCIAAVIGVKDEVDLIAACVENLFSIGVDFVAIVDDDSADGTKEVIKRISEEQPSRIIALRPGDFGSYPNLDGPVFSEVITKFRPDWLLVCDADEFHLPKAGNLKALDELRFLDLIVIPRFNVAFSGPDGFRNLRLDRDTLMDLPLIQGMDFFSAQDLAAFDTSDRWIMRRVAPKLMVRPQVAKRLLAGMHDIEPARHADLKRGVPVDLIIVHLPFTSYDRFRRKIDNIRCAFERFDVEGSWHWRRWLRIAEAGGIAAEFARQIVSPEELKDLTATGKIRSAREIFGSENSIECHRQ